MGNICRSPAAEGVFRNLVKQEGMQGYFYIDSAGTHAYHVGDPPDPRAQRAALQRGVDISSQRARQVQISDFEEFDHILVMDRYNYDTLMFVCPRGHAHKVRLFLDFVPQLETREVPDPYYGGGQGFDRVLDLVEEASRGFLASVSGVTEDSCPTR